MKGLVLLVNERRAWNRSSRNGNWIGYKPTGKTWIRVEPDANSNETWMSCGPVRLWHGEDIKYDYFHELEACDKKKPVAQATTRSYLESRQDAPLSTLPRQVELATRGMIAPRGAWLVIVLSSLSARKYNVTMDSCPMPHSLHPPARHRRLRIGRIRRSTLRER